MRLALAALFAAWLALLAVSLAVARLPGGDKAHFADADDLRLASQGVGVYRHQCRMCHGDERQGQPYWRLVDKDAGRRAPALDATGRAWRRSDEDLFQVVKYGRYPEAARDGVSYMPAYGRGLSDEQILAVLAFVKDRWPIGLRALQATMNPGERGMPGGAAAGDWRLPPTCFGHNVVAAAPSR